jgi:hypothetical protein
MGLDYRTDPGDVPMSEPNPGLGYRSAPEQENREPNQEQLGQYLAQVQQAHAQLTAISQQCMMAVNADQPRMVQEAAMGRMPQPLPCSQNFPQWTSQLAFLEAQISRVQNGDTRSLPEITGVYIHPSHSP